MPSRSIAMAVCFTRSSFIRVRRKSGKPTLAALVVLVMVLLRQDGRFAEGFVIANDLDQAVSRVFTVIRRIVEASPLLRHEAKITSDQISFAALDATIIAIASDAVSAAGGNPVISCFDELWGYTSERSRRLWDEMITSPARKISCRLTVSMRASPASPCYWRTCTSEARRYPRSGRACGRRHAVRMAYLAGGAVAGRAVAGGDAAQPASQRLCADDLRRVRLA
jgi:Phage Terminase